MQNQNTEIIENEQSVNYLGWRKKSNEAIAKQTY